MRFALSLTLLCLALIAISFTSAIAADGETDAEASQLAPIVVGQPEAIKRCCVVRDRPEEWVAAIETQARNAARSTPEWDTAVSDALNASYFGNSIQQLAALIRSGTMNG